VYGEALDPLVTSSLTLWFFIRLQRWTRDNALSFVPPEGRFILADYQYKPPQGALISNVPLPLSLKANVDMGEFGGKVDR